MARKKARRRYPSDDPAMRRAQYAAQIKADTGKDVIPRKPRGARTRRSPSTRQAPTAAAAPLPAAPAPSKDFAAFTRPRGAAAKQGKAMPALAELAATEAPELAAVIGGSCRSCGRPHGDDDRHCAGCGAALRRVCGKCDRPLRPEQPFCTECGTAAATADAQQATAIATRVAPAPLDVELRPAWQTDDMFFVGWAVDAALVHMNGSALDDEDRDRINERAARVANKRFRVGGRWKEEIDLGIAICAAIFPTAYEHFVIRPEEKRKHAGPRAVEASAVEVH